MRTLAEIDAAIDRIAADFAALAADDDIRGPLMAASGLVALERVAMRLLGTDHPRTVALRTDREARQAEAEVQARLALAVLGGTVGIA